MQIRHQQIIILFVIVLSLFWHVNFISAQEIKVVDNPLTLMTFNIRVNTAKDTGDRAWENRRDKVINQIKKADIIGLQEVSYTQLSYLLDHLDGYAYVGEGRSGGNLGEFNPIFYKTSKYTVLESNTFWLSHGRIPRIVTWAKFQNGADEFYIFNTHLSKSNTSRNNSVKKIIKKVNKLSSNTLAFLMGDFNSKPSSKTYSLLTKHYLDVNKLAIHHGPKKTFTGWMVAKKRLDYIFVNYKFNIKSSSTIKTKASDHYPVLIKSKQ
ncbi:MAG: endonuclease/exonuclease/phosphatase family protein [Patescibacteria group bacterium]